MYTLGEESNGLPFTLMTPRFLTWISGACSFKILKDFSEHRIRLAFELLSIRDAGM